MFHCQDCGKQYALKDNLTTHINNVHKGMKYKCDQCDKEFASDGARYTHIKRNFPVPYAIIKQHNRILLQNIKNQFIINQFMKV